MIKICIHTVSDRVKWPLLLLAFVFVPTVTVHAKANLITRIQAFYDRSQTLDAHFRQVSIRARTGRKKVRSGRIRVQRPKKIRWDYTTPDPIHYVSDGDLLWVYQPRDALAYKMPLNGSGLDEAVQFLAGSVRLSETFNATEVAAPEGIGIEGLSYVKLVPKKGSSAVRQLILGARPDDGTVIHSILTDPDGNQIQTQYKDLKFNALSGSIFQFTPPRGVRIEDLSRRNGLEPAPLHTPEPDTE
jgi:outer membrane lipoprotein carrier protein